MVLFEILAAVGLCGVLLFLFLRPVSLPSPQLVNGEAEVPAKISARQSITGVIKLIMDPRMVCLSFIIAYTGVTQTFFSGNLPLFINNFDSGDANLSDLSIKLVRLK